VRVATQEAQVVDNREMPDVCLQHMVAVMLMDGTASFRSAHDAARMTDPATLRQRAKVELVPDRELDLLLPKREAIVEIVLKDGTKLTQRCCFRIICRRKAIRIWAACALNDALTISSGSICSVYYGALVSYTTDIGKNLRQIIIKATCQIPLKHYAT
jgi:hypothetical protein